MAKMRFIPSNSVDEKYDVFGFVEEHVEDDFDEMFIGKNAVVKELLLGMNNTKRDFFHRRIVEH